MAETGVLLVGAAGLSAASVVSFANAFPVARTPLIQLMLVIGLVVAQLGTLLVSAGRMRKAQTTLGHYAAHDTLFNEPQVNEKVGEAISLFLMVQPDCTYRPDHTVDHHGKKLCTFYDPDLQFLIKLGFRPGKPARWNERHLVKTLLSPQFHALFFWMRLKANLLDKRTSPQRRALGWAWNLGVIATVALACWGIGTLLPLCVYLLAWWVPNVIGLQASSLLQFTSEHQWLRVYNESDTQPFRVTLARLTPGRFCAPAWTPRTCWDWARWWGEMLVIHLPVRTFVLCGTLCAHDHHHRAARSKQWPIEFWTREAAIHQKGGTRQEEPYTELWGIGNSIHYLFALWEQLPPLPEDFEAMSWEELDSFFSSM